MRKSCQKKKIKTQYKPDIYSSLQKTGPVKRSYRERFSDLFYRIKNRSTKKEFQICKNGDRGKEHTINALRKEGTNLFDDLNIKIRHENGEKQTNGRKERLSRKDLFESYQNLCRPKKNIEDENIVSTFPNYQEMDPLMASVLIEMFNNEPEFKKIFRRVQEETKDTPKVLKDEHSTKRTDEEVKYELGKTVSNGTFSIKMLELLGEGSQAVIYKAQKGSETYAAKVSKAAFTKMILHEYELVSSIKHPNILTVYEQLPDGYAMEILPDDLWTYIQKNCTRSFHSLPLRDTISVGLLRAVSHLHSNGIAHLDIKPENILLAVNGEPKLADFGLSLRFRDTAGRLRSLKGMRGSLPYLSPEVLSGRERNSMAPIDTWAVGVVMYALFTGGRLPFGNISTQDVFQQQLQGPIAVPYKMKGLVQNNSDYANYFSVIYQLFTLEPKRRLSAISALSMIDPLA